MRALIDAMDFAITIAVAAVTLVPTLLFVLWLTGAL